MNAPRPLNRDESTGTSHPREQVCKPKLPLPAQVAGRLQVQGPLSRAEAQMLPPTNQGNGAREAMIELCADRYVAMCHAPAEADAILADLQVRGYKVVPLGDADGETKHK